MSHLAIPTSRDGRRHSVISSSWLIISSTTSPLPFQNADPLLKLAWPSGSGPRFNARRKTLLREAREVTPICSSLFRRSEKAIPAYHPMVSQNFRKCLVHINYQKRRQATVTMYVNLFKAEQLSPVSDAYARFTDFLQKNSVVYTINPNYSFKRTVVSK